MSPSVYLCDQSGSILWIQWVTNIYLQILLHDKLFRHRVSKIQTEWELFFKADLHQQIASPVVYMFGRGRSNRIHWIWWILSEEERLPKAQFVTGQRQFGLLFLVWLKLIYWLCLWATGTWESKGRDMIISLSKTWIKAITGRDLPFANNICTQFQWWIRTRRGIQKWCKPQTKRPTWSSTKWAVF